MARALALVLRLERLDLVEVLIEEWDAFLLLQGLGSHRLAVEDLCGACRRLLRLLDRARHRLCAAEVEVQIEEEILIHIELLRRRAAHGDALTHRHRTALAVLLAGALRKHWHLLRAAEILWRKLLMLHLVATIRRQLDPGNRLNKLKQLELVLRRHHALQSKLLLTSPPILFLLLVLHGPQLLELLLPLYFIEPLSPIYRADLQICLRKFVVDKRVVNVLIVLDFADDLVHVHSEARPVLRLAEAL